MASLKDFFIVFGGNRLFNVRGLANPFPSLVCLVLFGSVLLSCIWCVQEIFKEHCNLFMFVLCSTDFGVLRNHAIVRRDACVNYIVHHWGIIIGKFDLVLWRFNRIYEDASRSRRIIEINTDHLLE